MTVLYTSIAKSACYREELPDAQKKENCTPAHFRHQQLYLHALLGPVQTKTDIENGAPELLMVIYIEVGKMSGSGT